MAAEADFGGYFRNMNRRAELKAFLVHLRLHYQFLILSGAFLSGAVFAGGPLAATHREGMPWSLPFLIQFLYVHVLLFGGVTVYNSYWDKDQGPIGGLRAPPPLAFWTLPAAWILQTLGLALAWRVSAFSAGIYAASMAFFWLYSRPRIRWKGRPWLSLVAIGAGTGMGGFLLGYLHDGRRAVGAAVLAGALGVTFLIVSLFPMSQVYQVEEDVERMDFTFTAKYGLAGVKRIYACLFPLGVVLLAGSMATLDPRLGAVFLVLGGASGFGVWRILKTLRMDRGEYGKVMAVKYAASGLFAAFLAIVLALQAAGLMKFPR
jgi:hypothetical protein